MTNSPELASTDRLLAPPSAPAHDPELGASGNGWRTGVDLPLRVLIVEDEAIASLHLRHMLAGLGYAVVDVADTAGQAIGLAVRHRPDVVLMDIRLGDGSDGIDAACQIRDMLGIPSIFLTAHNDPGTLARARNARPVGHVTKPFTRDDIATALRKVIEERDRSN